MYGGYAGYIGLSALCMVGHQTRLGSQDLGVRIHTTSSSAHLPVAQVEMPTLRWDVQ